MEQFDRALPLYERSLTIRLNTFGPSHPAVAQSLNNLAGMRYRQGDHQTAINLYEQSMDIKMKLYGAENADVAESLNNIAVMHMEAKKYTSAIHFQRRAVSLLERLFGPDHPHTMNVKGNLGIAYIRNEDHSSGEPLLREAMNFLIDRQYPATHPWVKKFKFELARLTSGDSRFHGGRMGSGGINSDSMSISSSDSDARSRFSNNQKKNNFLMGAGGVGDRYINPGKIKRAPVKVSAPLPPPPSPGGSRIHRMNSDGEIVELSDVKLIESDDESEVDDNELDLEHIIVDDFFLTEDGSVDVERAMQMKASKSGGQPSTPAGATGAPNRISVKSSLKQSQQQSQRKQSPRSIPLSTPLSGIGIDSSDAAFDSSGAGSGNDSSSVRSGRRGTYRDNTTRITAEKRLENLTKASNSRQISVNIVDKTSRTRRPSAGSLSDSSTGVGSGPRSPTSAGEQRVVRPKVHDRKNTNQQGSERGMPVPYSTDSGDAGGESSASSLVKDRGRQFQV